MILFPRNCLFFLNNFGFFRPNQFSFTKIRKEEALIKAHGGNVRWQDNSATNIADVMALWCWEETPTFIKVAFIHEFFFVKPSNLDTRFLLIISENLNVESRVKRKNISSFDHILDEKWSQ